MPGKTGDRTTLHLTTRAAWRAWLRKHHTTAAAARASRQRRAVAGDLQTRARRGAGDGARVLGHVGTGVSPQLHSLGHRSQAARDAAAPPQGGDAPPRGEVEARLRSLQPQVTTR